MPLVRVALRSNITGNFNAAMGVEALYSNTTGTFNTGISGYSGRSLTTQSATATRPSGRSHCSTTLAATIMSWAE